jgi:hypothetical protein
LLSNRKNLINETGRIQGHVQIGLCRNDRTSTVVVSPKPFSPTPTSSAMKTPENTAEDPDDPEQADEGETQMEYYSDQLYNPNIGAETKKLPVRTHVSVGTVR